MNPRHAAALLSAIALTLAVSTPARAQTSESVSAETRSFLRFVEDASIVPAFWLEGQGRYLTNRSPFGDSEAEDSNVLYLGPVVAFNVAEDFEFGARVGYANRDRDEGGSQSGLTDADLWGKVSIVSDPMSISVGILLTMPTGDERKFLGTGETDVEFFSGIRKDLKRVTLSGHAGLRINQDPDFEDVDVEGKNSWLLGGGLIISATQNLGLLLEWAYESERLEGADKDSRIMGGFHYRIGENFRFRAAAGFGISDGAPDTELQAGAVLVF
jgi:hypothetical protein